MYQLYRLFNVVHHERMIVYSNLESCGWKQKWPISRNKNTTKNIN